MIFEQFSLHTLRDREYSDFRNRIRTNILFGVFEDWRLL
ncbi:hypothetical protein H1P_2400012 [Hyella patelloides LEGE 07179]|uniref:Uncharacterized protein n=1 Tax=Hyella patelloides LEGE 07179 TaxID=945734 RepID=A0A563VRM5_9CYAN|nr:hypothetical protein H1P_2400012 [Hyella patelloides LEGE 07179]